MSQINGICVSSLYCGLEQVTRVGCILHNFHTKSSTDKLLQSIEHEANKCIASGLTSQWTEFAKLKCIQPSMIELGM